MANETSDSRFKHLLKPIRDIAENWNIDVARELEDYLHEVCLFASSVEPRLEIIHHNLQIENLEFKFEDSAETFNFAEAALVIQGSACIYSKKANTKD